jgi:hypothetical protein
LKAKLISIVAVAVLAGIARAQAQDPAGALVKAPVAGDPLYAPIATADPPTLEQKFMIFAIETTGPRALFSPAIPAGIQLLRPKAGYPRDWQHGPGAFGRLYGSELASRSALQAGRFAASALLHEDFRYRPAKSKNPVGRFLHAVGFTFVDRSDSGHDRIAIANFAGAAAGGFTSDLFLPRGFNDATHAGQRSMVAFGELAGRNVLREFAPDLARLVAKRHLPFPRSPIPEWWVKR